VKIKFVSILLNLFWHISSNNGKRTIFIHANLFLTTINPLKQGTLKEENQNATHD